MQYLNFENNQQEQDVTTICSYWKAKPIFKKFPKYSRRTEVLKVKLTTELKWQKNKRCLL